MRTEHVMCCVVSVRDCRVMVFRRLQRIAQGRWHADGATKRVLSDTRWVMSSKELLADGCAHMTRRP